MPTNRQNKLLEDLGADLGDLRTVRLTKAEITQVFRTRQGNLMAISGLAPQLELDWHKESLSLHEALMLETPKPKAKKSTTRKRKPATKKKTTPKTTAKVDGKAAKVKLETSKES